MKQRRNPSGSAGEGQTVCARVSSANEGVTRRHASIEFAPFQPREDTYQRQYPRRARHD